MPFQDKRTSRPFVKSMLRMRDERCITLAALMSRVFVMPRSTKLAFAGMFVLVALAGLAEPGLALTMAPALLMLALFAGGVRPGEALIERLRSSRVTPVPPRAVSAPQPRLALVVRPAGRLIASALAMRPPPAPLAVSN
jgi:hypothetical protein